MNTWAWLTKGSRNVAWALRVAEDFLHDILARGEHRHAGDAVEAHHAPEHPELRHLEALVLPATATSLSESATQIPPANHRAIIAGTLGRMQPRWLGNARAAHDVHIGAQRLLLWRRKSLRDVAWGCYTVLGCG